MPRPPTAILRSSPAPADSNAADVAMSASAASLARHMVSLPTRVLSARELTSARSAVQCGWDNCARLNGADRKSTRLNSSHDQISYAVFCLKKKKTENIKQRIKTKKKNKKKKQNK